MKPNGYQSYPSGYRSPVWGTRLMTIAPDPQIVSLMSKYQAYLLGEDVWEFKATLIAETRRLFGDFSEWLEAQDDNVYISQTAYDLIVDTINFIKTGKRVISLSAYRGIIAMERKHGTYHSDNAERRVSSLKELLTFPTHDYIHMWLMHPNGMEDMLCTVHFIFGTEVQ